jgi:undecaprenyl-diphosphatase
VKTFSLTPAELEIVKAGLSDSVTGAKAQVELEAYGPKVNELAQKRMSAGADEAKKKGQEFADKAAAEQGASKTASGLVYKTIKAYLFNGPVVATAFIVGGLIILWVERRAKPVVRIHDIDEMTAWDALKVGMVQCLGMIPGTSRSGATIIGGMLLGLSRKAATDFSFFLAIPTLFAAGAYSLWKERALLSLHDLPLFAVGFVVSFLSAWLCVRWLLRYIASHDFVPFAWYRIAFGIVVLATAWSGLVVWAA